MEKRKDSGDVLQGKDAMEVVFELSKLLNTGLDRETLAILVSLLEKGVHPEALAAAYKELHRSNEEEESTLIDDKQFQY